MTPTPMSVGCCPARSLPRRPASLPHHYAYCVFPSWRRPPELQPRRLASPPHAGGGGFFDGLLKGLADVQQQLSPSADGEAAQLLEGDDEEEFGGKFVPLDPGAGGSVDGGSDAPFGPLAVLAVGLPADEHATLLTLFAELGAEEVAIVPCTRAMLSGTLGEALGASPPPPHEAPALGQLRVLFLSGMFPSEVVEVVAAIRESSLPEMILAAAVPRSWGRTLSELVADVAADHAEVAKRRAEAALAAARADAAGLDDAA